jgi:hypothetical protein
MEPKHIVFFIFALLVGCDRCYGLRLTSPTGESHRLSQAYVRTYGSSPSRRSRAPTT